MIRLKAALEQQGIEPCRHCPNADHCATGYACQAFSMWADTRRIITDRYVWEQSRRKHPARWRPLKATYKRLYPCGGEAAQGPAAIGVRVG